MEINIDKLKYRQSTIALALNKDNKILIIQKQSFDFDKWDFPGGGIDGNERADEALLRELKEELNSDKFIIEKVGKELDKYEWSEEYIIKRFKKDGKFYRGQERTRFLVKFSGEENEIKIQEEEIRKFKWVKIGELEKYLVFPGQFDKIKKVMEEFGISQ